MNFKINEASKPRHLGSGNVQVVFLIVVVGVLAVINVIAYLETRQAKRSLAKVQRVVAITNDLRAQREELSRLMTSVRREDMRAALDQAIEEARPASVLVAETNSMRPDLSSFNLYSPDDSVSLVLQLDVWKGVAARTRQLKSGEGTEESERIEVALEAGQLHLFSIGFDDSVFRVKFDDRDLSTIRFPGFQRTGSSEFHRASAGLIGLPNTLNSHYYDFADVVSLKQWTPIVDERHSLSRLSTLRSTGQAKPVGAGETVVRINAVLSSSSEKFISPVRYLVAKDALSLEWDAQSKRYRVMGVKSKR